MFSFFYITIAKPLGKVIYTEKQTAAQLLLLNCICWCV